MPSEPPEPDNSAYWHQPRDAFDEDAPPRGSHVSEPPSPDRLSWLMFVIGWSSSELARRLNVDPETARLWISGRHSVPLNVAAWLELLATFHLMNRLPEGWP